MTYNIKNSRNDILTSIVDGDVDTTSTSLVLHGRGAPLYGLQRNENIVHLLENFSKTSAPTNPIDGQLWWNTGDQMYVWDSTLGSPTDWIALIPPSVGFGFNVVAGDGLTGGGLPTGSPLSVTIDVGIGTGITTTAAGQEISFTSFSIFGSPANGTIINDGTWQDFSKVNTILNTSSLNVGDDYFLFYAASFGNPNDVSVNNNMLRLIDDTGSPVTVIPFSQLRLETANDPDEGHSYAFFTSYTATGNDIRAQGFGTAATLLISYPRAFAISQTDLASNALYSEDTVGIAGIGDTYVDSAATITLDNGTDDYIVFWSLQWEVNTATRDILAALRFGSGSPQSILEVFQIETEDTNDQYVHGGYVVFPATNNFGSPTGSPLVLIGSPVTPVPITLAVRQQTGNFSDNLLRAAIGAIKLSAFETHFAHFNPNLNTGYSNNELLDVENFIVDTTTPSDWFFLAGASVSPGGGNPSSGIVLQAGIDIGSPTISLSFGGVGSPDFTISISPETIGHDSSGLRPQAAFGTINSVPVGATLTAQITGIGTAGVPIDYNKSLVGFPLNFTGGEVPISADDSAIVHDNLSGFVANEHVDHSSVILTAGAGMVSTGDITSTVTFNVGGGDGIDANANDVAVDSTVVRTNNNQTIGGIKIFTNQIRAAITGTSSAIPAYGFSSNTNTGMYRSASNQLSFTTNAIQRFRIESNGVLRAIDSTYETLVTNDDDIPNKKYVDDLVAGGTTPTDNTFVGTSSISGLNGSETYLVHAYGIAPPKTTGFATLAPVVLRRGSTTPGSGTIVAQTPSAFIDWPDGDIPMEAAFICPMSGDTTINVQFDGTIPSNIRNALHMTAIQITSIT